MEDASDIVQVEVYVSLSNNNVCMKNRYTRQKHIGRGKRFSLHINDGILKNTIINVSDDF